MHTSSDSSASLPGELRRLAEMEFAFTAQRKAALGELSQGQPVSPDTLDTVVLKILPQCLRVLELISTCANDDASTDAPMQRLKEFVQLHQLAWQAFERAVRSNDFDQAQLHVRLMAESVGLIRESDLASQPAGPQGQMAHFRQVLFSITPHIWAVPTIVVANVVVFLAMAAAGANVFMPKIDLVLQWGANHGPLTLDGQWWRVFTCMFLHFGLLHIGFNMYVLWQIGRLVERLVGNLGLLILYVASGIFASIASLAWNPTAVSAGASGAVFGVCGALLGFIALRRDTIPRVVLKDLRGTLITFVIYNVVFGAVVPAIDMAAHMGGLVFGTLCGLLLSQPLVYGAEKRRWRRNVFCAVVSAVVLPISFGLLPSVAYRDLPEVAAIKALNMEAKEILQEQQRRRDDGVITDSDLADVLERDLVPIWEKALRVLDSGKGKRPQDRAGPGGSRTLSAPAVGKHTTASTRTARTRRRAAAAGVGPVERGHAGVECRRFLARPMNRGPDPPLGHVSA